jgi:XapX domain-containing protein
MFGYLASLGMGLLVGVAYGFVHVRSPAPPLIALIGLLGMVIGEQAVGSVRQAFAPPAPIGVEGLAAPGAAAQPALPRMAENGAITLDPRCAADRQPGKSMRILRDTDDWFAVQPCRNPIE